MLSGDKVGGWMALLAHRIDEFFREVLAILGNLPAVPGAFHDSLSRAFLPSAAIRSLGATLLLLFCCVALVLLPHSILRRHPFQPAWAMRSRFAILIVTVLNDLVALGSAILIAGCSTALFFTHQVTLEQLAVGVMWAVTRWRIAMLGIDVFLRPGRLRFRLLPVGEATAQSVMRLISFVFALALTFVSIVPVLLMHDLPLQPARALALVLAVVEIPLCLLATRSLANGIPKMSSRIWFLGAVVTLLFWVTWVGSVIALDFTFYDALTEMMAVIWIIAIAYQMGRLALRPGEMATDGQSESSSQTTNVLLINCIRRCALVIGVAVGILFNAKRWAVEVTGIVGVEHWPAVAGSLGLTIVVAVTGYLGFEALQSWSAVRFGPRTTSIGFGADDGEEAAHIGSRLATILPVLSRILLFSFIGLAILLGLSDYGVNIGPLLAGGGIFGLAISFGSQALVRDIVSGFFFIVDDAFRWVNILTQVD